MSKDVLTTLKGENSQREIKHNKMKGKRINKKRVKRRRNKIIMN